MGVILFDFSSQSPTSIQIQKCHPYTDSRNLGMVKTHFYIVKMVYIHTNAAYTNAAYTNAA